jgi:hypothetical protein
MGDAGGDIAWSWQHCLLVENPLSDQKIGNRRSATHRIDRSGKKTSAKRGATSVVPAGAIGL